MGKPRSLQRGAKKARKAAPPPAGPNLNLVDYTVALSRSVLVRGAIQGEVDPTTIEDRLARQRKRYLEMPADDLATLLLNNLADHHFHFA